MRKVFFTDMHAKYGNSLEKKFKTLLKEAGLKDFIEEGELVAIKVHVGERGNLGYINHNFARVTAEEVKKLGGKPFFTDTNTLYSGGRHNAVDHCITANLHGYSFGSVGAPFIVADGLRGLDYEEIEINRKRVKTAKLATGILKADKVIFLSHFKGHLEAGFGGSIKNMAMGVGAVPGKLEQHSASKPEVVVEKCVGCRQCYMVCPVSAITMENRKAVIDYDKCIGCGQCVASCNYAAMTAKFDQHHEEFLETMCEYAYAVDHYFKERAFYVNFAMNITPDCDCWPANDMPIVSDVGILASNAPLALDRATLDLIQKAPVNPNSGFSDKIQQKKNVFHEIRPDIPADHVMKYCKELGMDEDYELLILK